MPFRTTTPPEHQPGGISGAPLGTGLDSTLLLSRISASLQRGQTSAQSGTCTDGVAVVFPQQFNSPPQVSFTGGGAVYSDALPAGTQVQQFSATKITSEGFTPVLKLAALSSALTSESDNFSPHNAATQDASATLSAVAYDDNYTVYFTLTANAGQLAVAVIYVNGVEVWSHRLFGADSGASQSFSPVINEAGLSIGDTFEIKQTGGSGAGSLSAGAVQYTSSSSSGATVTATPAGATPVGWLAYLSA